MPGIPAGDDAAYSLATAGAIQRVESLNHWPSDVFIAAAYGTFVAHTVVRYAAAAMGGGGGGGGKDGQGGGHVYQGGGGGGGFLFGGRFEARKF